MDSIKEDIHKELLRLRLDKQHVYTTLLKIIDAIPQESVVHMDTADTKKVNEGSSESVEPIQASPVTKKTTRKKTTVKV
jgi:hypothetical protein